MIEIIGHGHTSRVELGRVSIEQEQERQWWKDVPSMRTVHDIEDALNSGRAERVEDVGIGYQVSQGVKEEFKVLERHTYQMLQYIAHEWLSRLQRRGHTAADIYLRITSLARTVEYQDELISQGYPAVTDSTHVKLGAFDILTSWLLDQRNRSRCIPHRFQSRSRILLSRVELFLIMEPLIYLLNMLLGFEFLDITE